MRQGTRRALTIAAGLCVSGVALFFFLQRLKGHWAEVTASFERANYLCLVPGIGFLALLYWLRVARWKLFLKPIRPVRGLSVASATCIGFMANCVLPARVGELIRPYVLHRKEGVPFGQALATAAGLERVFDLIGLAALMLLTWALLSARLSDAPAGASAGAAVRLRARDERRIASGPASGSQQMGGPRATPDSVRRIWRGGIVFVAIAGAGACLLLAIALFPRAFRTGAEACVRILPRRWRGAGQEFLHSIAEAMGFLKSSKGVGLAGLYSVGLWVAQGLSTYALAVGLGLDIGVSGSFLAVIAIAVAVALPQGPAFIGPFQWAAAVAAESFQTGRGEAGAFALLMWAVNVLPITLVGLGFLWYEGLSLKSLMGASRRMRSRDS